MALRLRDERTGVERDVEVSDVIHMIETFGEGYVYCGDGKTTPRATVHVRQGNGFKWPQTDADATSANNLDNLPTF
jgi:hypothetical protein